MIDKNHPSGLFEKILLVGGRSFFGRHIYEELISRYPSAQVVRTSRYAKPETNWIELNPSEWWSVERAISYVKPDLVINSSGVASGSFHNLLATNAIAPAMLAEFVGRIVPEARLVLLGSAAEYGVKDTMIPLSETDELRGNTLYGVSKRFQHRLMPRILRSARNTVYLRIFNLIGQHMPPHLLLGKVLKITSQKIAANDFSPINVGYLGDYRDFIEASTSARLTLTLAESEVRGETINIGSGKCAKVRHVLKTWLEEQDPKLSNIEIREGWSREPNYSLAEITKLNSLVHRPDK